MKSLLAVILIAAVIVLLLFTFKGKDTVTDPVSDAGKNNAGERAAGEQSYPREVMGALEKARHMSLETKINNIREALNAYYIDNNEYPEMPDMLVPDYLKTEDQLKDPWGNRFKIETDEEMNLILVSPGRDGILGNSNDIRRRI